MRTEYRLSASSLQNGGLYNLSMVLYGDDGRIQNVVPTGVSFAENSGPELGLFIKQVQEAFQQAPVVWQVVELVL